MERKEAKRGYDIKSCTEACVWNLVLLPPLSEAGRTQTVTPSEFEFMMALWWWSEEWDMLAPVEVGKGDKKQGNWLKGHFCWPRTW